MPVDCTLRLLDYDPIGRSTASEERFDRAVAKYFYYFKVPPNLDIWYPASPPEVVDRITPQSSYPVSPALQEETAIEVVFHRESALEHPTFKVRASAPLSKLVERYLLTVGESAESFSYFNGSVELRADQDFIVGALQKKVIVTVVPRAP